MELLKEIYATTRRNKLRTALTGFSVAWGIFMLIFLLGAGNGIINAQKEQSSQNLENSIEVSGGMTSKAYGGLKEGRTIKLKDKDIAITQSTFRHNVTEVEGRLTKSNISISYGEDYIVSQSITGVYPADEHLRKTKIVAGRFINQLDMRTCRKVIVISQDQQRDLTAHQSIPTLIGQHLRIGGIAYEVVGIYRSEQSRSNTNAIVPYTTLKQIYGMGDEAGTLLFSVEGLATEQQNHDFEHQYRAAINTNHHADPTDESAIFIDNACLDNLQMTQGLHLLTISLWVIGLFTLLSGVVGVSNIMLITVRERTHEFGIRKAIGAKPSEILKLIITESLLITALFGYIGMLVGLLANELMDHLFGHTTATTELFSAAMFVNPTVGLDVCLQATAVIIIAGTLAGLLPALKAARIRPIQALNES